MIEQKYLLSVLIGVSPREVEDFTIDDIEGLTQALMKIYGGGGYIKQMKGYNRALIERLKVMK